MFSTHPLPLEELGHLLCVSDVHLLLLQHLTQETQPVTDLMNAPVKAVQEAVCPHRSPVVGVIALAVAASDRRAELRLDRSAVERHDWRLMRRVLYGFERLDRGSVVGERSGVLSLVVVEVAVAQLVVVGLLRMREGLLMLRLRALLLVMMVVLVAPHYLWGGGALGLGSHVTGG